MPYKSIEPTSFFPPEEVTNKMTFFQRTLSLLQHIAISVFHRFVSNVTDTSVYAPEKEVKAIEWIHAHSALFLTNVEVNALTFPVHQLHITDTYLGEVHILQSRYQLILRSSLQMPQTESSLLHLVR